MSGLGDLEAICVDLDGTLTDPKIGITGCIRYALGKLDIPSPPTDELTQYIGPPLHESFIELTGNKADADAALAHYRERYGKTGMYENSVYPGIIEAVSSLHAAGHRLFVATSKAAVYAGRIIDHYGFGDYFERVFGSELDGTRADKTDLLAHVLGETGVAPDKTIMIGDRRFDITGARNNGITAVGVLYGYGSHEELTGAGAHHLCATPGEVADLVLKVR